MTVIYRATKRRGGYPPPATNTEKKSSLTNTKPVRYISTKRRVKLICSGNAELTSCSEANSRGFEVFEYSIRARLQRCSLLYILTKPRQRLFWHGKGKLIKLKGIENNKRVIIPNEAYLKIFHSMLNPSEKYCHLFALKTIVRRFPKDTMFCYPMYCSYLFMVFSQHILGNIQGS